LVGDICYKSSVMEHDIEESTPGDDYESLNIRHPRGEYDLYQIDIDYLNVLFKDIDMICHLDDNNGIGKPPDKLHERTKSKHEPNEQLIADKQGTHEGIDIGNNIDLQGDIAAMTFDMHQLVVDSYDNDNGDDDEDDDNCIDGNDIDDNVDSLNDENKQHKKRISTPDSSEWGICPNCMGCGFVGNIRSECNEDGVKFERHTK
jgi:hypothetical protein